MSDVPEPIREALRGRYRIERLLGEGGMATVYLAQDERHDRRVAVKVLRPELAATIGVERFNREIAIAARLNHPHILPLLDSGTIDVGTGRPASVYYVMPFVEGESLRDRLRREGKLPLPVALRLAREVADALDHAHRHGVIHRDIKPENILLSEQHAVVADFGIARALDQAAAGTITHAGQSIGTPAYMSPEQVTGEREIDGRADLYALGCTLFEMLSGQAPWSGPMAAMLARRLAEPAPRIRTLEPTVPVAVEDALAQVLAREPEERFDTPADFAAALEQSITGEGGGRGVPSRKRRRNALLIGAVALVAVGFGLTRLAGVGHADAITSLVIAPDSAEPSVAFLSDGIQEAVANLLRRVPQLRITAPSLVAQLRRQQPTMNYLQLAERLNVGAVLTWRLVRDRDSVRVSAELFRVPGGELEWTVRYARPFADVAAIQGETARMIADSLQVQLTGSEVATMERRPTVSADAYAHYLKARQFYIRGVPLGAADARMLMDSAAYYLRAALAEDSSFAQAYGLLGTYYFVTAFRGWGPFAQYQDSAIMVGSRALAIDSTMGNAWVDRLSKAIYLDDDWSFALAKADRALRLSQRDPTVMQFAGIILAEVGGQLDTAIALLRDAVELEPSIPTLNTLGDLLMRAGRYDSAVVVLRRALEYDPSVPGPRRRLILSLERLKRYDEAIGVRRLGGDSAGAAAFARAFLEGGEAGYERARREELQRQLAVLLTPLNRPYKLPDDTVPQLREERIAERYALLGDWSKAMDWVLTLYSHRPKRFRLVVANPLYRGLRNDPRFLPLVRKEGLEGLLPP